MYHYRLTNDISSEIRAGRAKGHERPPEDEALVAGDEGCHDGPNHLDGMEA